MLMLMLQIYLKSCNRVTTVVGHDSRLQLSIVQVARMMISGMRVESSST